MLIGTRVLKFFVLDLKNIKILMPDKNPKTNKHRLCPGLELKNFSGHLVNLKNQSLK